MEKAYRAGDIVLGNWKLVRLIGEGSFGSVFEAEREDFGTTYKAAIKIITIPKSDSEIQNARAEGMDHQSVTSYFRGFVNELVQEFALMSKLKGNSNVVSYEDHMVIEHEDRIGWDIIIRMELLTPLLDYVEKNTMSRTDILHLGIDICRALELCQIHNIVHRDIKPENIFISELGAYKLGDFGIARTIEKTSGGLSKKGTYTYMAPEVYREAPYNATVDIYSLGIVLYRLLNDNRAPFLPAYPAPITYNDRESALAKRMTGAPLPAPKNADPALTRIVLKACAYQPSERYASPAQMREELEALLGDEKHGTGTDASAAARPLAANEQTAHAAPAAGEETVYAAPSAGEETVYAAPSAGEETVYAGPAANSRTGIDHARTGGTTPTAGGARQSTDIPAGEAPDGTVAAAPDRRGGSKKLLLIAAAVLAVVLLIVFFVGRSGGGDHSSGSGGSSADAAPGALAPTVMTDSGAVGYLLQNEDYDSVEIGTPEKPLDPQKIYDELTYAPAMFLGSYRLPGGDAAREQFLADSEFVEFVDYNYSNGHTDTSDITSLPIRYSFTLADTVKLAEHLEGANPDTDFVMKLQYLTKEGYLKDIPGLFTIDGRKLTVTLLRTMDYSAENGYTYDLSDTVLEYDFTFCGTSLTLARNGKSVTLKAGYISNDDAGPHLYVSHRLNESSPALDTITKIDFLWYYDEPDSTRLHISFLDRDDYETTLYENSGILSEDGLFTFTVPYNEGNQVPKTYQFVYFYCDDEGLILTDGEEFYIFTAR